MTLPCNIAAALPRLARERPEQIAIRCPGRRLLPGMPRYDIALTYVQLNARSDAIAAGLAGVGIVRGMRAVVMVRPTPEFFLLMFALFKAGVVPVLVDPGIDRRALRQCLDEAQPHAFIGIPLAHLARVLLRWARGARVRVTTGERAWLADATLAQVEAAGARAIAAGARVAMDDTAPDDVAAILFTSGSTGVPKGVVYRHRHFVAQIDMLRRAFGLQAGGIDLPTFPPFALFDPALGLTSIIPDMDPTRPASADPRKLVSAIERFGVTQLFGSPALMRVLADHGAALPTVTRVTSAGAPVPMDVVQRMQALLPADAQFWTPYGATECLPVAVIEGRELLTLRARIETGAGTCVGRAVLPNEVRIIRVSDEPIAEWNDDLLVKGGQVGEITVAGPSVTDCYFNRDATTTLAKIRERPSGLLTTDVSSKHVIGKEGADGLHLGAMQTSRDRVSNDVVDVYCEIEIAADAHSQRPVAIERIVHRMGDLGYMDREGRLWFCGRKSQRVVTATTTLCTEQVEPVFNTHADVARTALVGIGERGAQTPVLCVELRKGIAASEWPRIADELRQFGEGHVHTAKVETFLHYPLAFPVDIRHNAKIGREKLAVWATKRLRRASTGMRRALADKEREA